MPSKAETKSIKVEIRALKSALNKKAKEHIRDCEKTRKAITKQHKQLEQKAGKMGSFELATDRRIAILEGRLNS